ncbi:MAG: SGNH/GDSL hydrolase family protein [Betaproteobacteria bacterium]|nr:SGNH/GDSL hydrolase family protein [Betaproteobacteria bacterium]
MVWQGRRVRRLALRLPEAAGARVGGTDTAGSAPRLLIVGDSSAAGVGVTEQSEALSGQLLSALAARGVLPRRWQLIARTGVAAASLPDLIDQGLDEARTPAESFDVALVVVGVNDVTGATPIARWLADLDRLHARLKGLGVRTAVFSGLPPMDRFIALPQPLRMWLGLQARRYDRALGQWSAARADTFHWVLPRLDDPALLASDGFHPSAAGCALWARELVQTLAPLLVADQGAAGSTGISRFRPESSIAT